MTAETLNERLLLLFLACEKLGTKNTNELCMQALHVFFAKVSLWGEGIRSCPTVIRSANDQTNGLLMQRKISLRKYSWEGRLGSLTETFFKAFSLDARCLLQLERRSFIAHYKLIGNWHVKHNFRFYGASRMNCHHFEKRLGELSHYCGCITR